MFADLYLIATFPSLKIDINDYPAVKAHLLRFGYDRLKQTGDSGSRKKTNNKWFETQDSIRYWEDFLRPKIIYPDIMRMPTQQEQLDGYPYFYLDKSSFFAEATNFILCGHDLELLCAYLSSALGFFSFAKFYTGPQFDDTGFRYKKEYLQNLLVPDFPLFEKSELLSFYEATARNDVSSNQLALSINQIDRIFMDGVGLTGEEIEYVKSFKNRLLAEKNGQS